MSFDNLTAENKSYRQFGLVLTKDAKTSQCRGGLDNHCNKTSNFQVKTRML
jgi:hypothetical protein